MGRLNRPPPVLNLPVSAPEVREMAKGNKKGGTSGSQQTGKKKRKGN
jgi:hypothetical protein